MARKPKANPASFGTIEGAQPDAACFPGGNHQGQGHDVAVGEFPYFLFEGFDLLQVCRWFGRSRMMIGFCGESAMAG